MHWDWTVNIGTVVQMLVLGGAILAGFASVKNELQSTKAVLRSHAQALEKHDAILGIYETRLFELVGGLQRLLGRIEGLEHMPLTRSKG